MLIMSWNVNSIRAAVRHGFEKFLRKQKPDVLCLQEIKLDDDARSKAEFDFKGYTEYWYPAKKKGYAGTALLIKQAEKIFSFSCCGGSYSKRPRFKNEDCFSATQPVVTAGIGIKKFDDEGRVQTAEFKNFYLINAYFPHSRHDLSRLDFKLEFDAAILKYIKKLKKNKPVIITGDFNVAHTEIDLKNPKSNQENPGFLPQEREWMTKLLKAGFIDTYRLMNGNKIQYTWWSYMFNARAKNIGWRIDYFIVSEKLKNKIKDGKILDQVTGSDHCPVSLKLGL